MLSCLEEGKILCNLNGGYSEKRVRDSIELFCMDLFLRQGFSLKEMIIKEQHNCKATGFWKTNSVKYNFLLLAHEHLFVFHKIS